MATKGPKWTILHQSAKKCSRKKIICSLRIILTFPPVILYTIYRGCKHLCI